MTQEIVIYRSLFKRVTDLVEREYGIGVEDLKSQSRVRKFIGPRHVAMWLIRTVGHRDDSRLDAYSYPRIARMFNRIDHSTSWHAVKEVERDRAESATFRERSDGWVNELRGQIEQTRRDAFVTALELIGEAAE